LPVYCVGREWWVFAINRPCLASILKKDICRVVKRLAPALPILRKRLPRMISRHYLKLPPQVPDEH